MVSVWYASSAMTPAGVTALFIRTAMVSSSNTGERDQSSSRYVSNRRNRNRHCILNRNMSTGIALAAPDPAAPEYHTS